VTSEANSSGIQLGEELSAQIVSDLTRASQPLPKAVELGRVRAVRTSQISALVRETLASEIQTWQLKIAELQELLSEAHTERSKTTRHELPRLAGLINEEKTRADQLETEMVTLEGRIQELEEELVEVRSAPVHDPQAAPVQAESDEELAGLKARIAELEGAILSLEAEDDSAFQLMEQYGFVEERTARLSLLEDQVWEIEEGRSTEGTQRRALEELRSRLDSAQRERQEALSTARETRLERDRLLMRVLELNEVREQGEIELAALMARYSSLEEALAESQAAVEKATQRRGAESAESMALAGQVGQGARREQELRNELEEKSRRELKLRRQISQLESKLRESAEPPLAGLLPPAADLLGVPDSVLDGLRLGTRVLRPGDLEGDEADLETDEAEAPIVGEFTAELSVEVPGESPFGLPGEASAAPAPPPPAPLVGDRTVPAEAALEARLAEAQAELDTLREAYEALTVSEPSAVEPSAVEPSVSAEASLRELLAAAQLDAEELRAAYQSLTGDMQVAKAAYSERSEALDCELLAVRGALADAKTATESVSEELKDAREKLAFTGEEAVNQVGALITERDALNEELGSARLAFQSVRELADGLSTRVRSANSHLAESRHAEAALTWMLDTVEEALERRLGAAEAVFDDLQSVRARSAGALAERDTKLKELRNELREARASQQEAEAKLAATAGLEASLAQAKARAEESSHRADDLELELAVVRGTLDGAKSAADMLRDSALRSEEGREDVVGRLRDADELNVRLGLEVSELKDALRGVHVEATERQQVELDAARQEGLELLRAAEREVSQLRDSAHDSQLAHSEELESLRAKLAEKHAGELERLNNRVGASDADGLEVLRAAEREIASLRAEKARDEAELRAEVEALRAQLGEAAGAPEVAAPSGGLELELGKVKAEVHDLERLLESECWRGLATHRDLVHAHERIREFERQAEAEREEPAAEIAEVAEVAEEAPEEVSAALAEQRQAIDWLVKASPNPDFVPEAKAALPELEQAVHKSRRTLRHMRSEFQAERKSLLEGAMTAERALENARDVGMPDSQFATKSKRATERLRKFDGDLDAQLKVLEETLHEQEDARLWLMREAGGAAQLREAESELLVEAKAAISRIEAEVDESKRQRHDVERDAMIAMQSLEEERAGLERELGEARSYGQREATQRLRLEDSVRQLQSQPARPNLLADKEFVRNAERMAVLSARLLDRESSLHWLLCTLDADFQKDRLASLAQCVDSVKAAASPEERQDLLCWLGVKAEAAATDVAEIGSRTLMRGELTAAAVGVVFPIDDDDDDPYVLPPSDETAPAAHARGRSKPATETLRPWAEEEAEDEEDDDEGGSWVW
jgi:chromosome segregation ATPase